jgi:hypothetical protein
LLRGWIAVTANPFHARTDSAGRFEIRDVPSGKWTLRVWHERFSERRIEVTVLPGRTLEVGTILYP